jgi:hypothetical protein
MESHRQFPSVRWKEWFPEAEIHLLVISNRK